MPKTDTIDATVYHAGIYRKISCVVTYAKTGETYDKKPIYSVMVDGKKVGSVERSTERWSKMSGRIRVKDYVRTSWRIHGNVGNYTVHYQTRKEATVALLTKELK